MQSQYTALLLIPTQPAGPGLERNQPWEGGQLPRADQEGRERCWLLEGGSSPSPSLPLGFPTGRQPLCVLQLRAATLSWLAGDAFTISSWLEDSSASYWAMTCVMSSSALNEGDVTFPGTNSLEMLCRSEIDILKTVFFSRCWHPKTYQVQIKEGYSHCRQKMGWEMTYKHSL